MTETRVHIVGGLFNGDLGSISASGKAALEVAEQIVFPGTWVSDKVREDLGTRLTFGWQTSVEETLSILLSGDESVLLYSGDPMLFTGRPGFPSALKLIGMLEVRGATVVLHPSLSSVQWALAAARLEVPPGEAPLVISSFFATSDSLDRFESKHDAETYLALLWFEDRIPAVWTALEHTRGESTRAYLVRGGAMSTPSVHEGTIAQLRAEFPTLKPPAVLLVEPGPRQLFKDADGRPTSSCGSAWAFAEAERILASDSSALTWIVGLPGAGKSTLLHAIRHLAPQSRCVELADVLASVVPGGPPVAGGGKRNIAAAEFIRSLVALDSSEQRWFVASAALGAYALGERDNETVYLIDVDANVCRARLAERSGARPWVIPDTGLVMFEKILAEVRSQSHVNVLVQRVHPHHSPSHKSVEP